MRRFHFQLEKILLLRVNREQEARRALGGAIGVLAGIENRLRRVAEEKAAASANRFAGSLADMRNYDLYLFRLDKTRDDLLEQAAKAQLAVEEARAAYLEASRERKILDKLKERREKEYRKAAFAEEVMTLDDISGRVARR